LKSVYDALTPAIFPLFVGLGVYFQEMEAIDTWSGRAIRCV